VRLWNRNFVLLWQGQLVSSLGDVVYEIALGFWILAVTGSTALMGTLMAASTLPRILVSPFCGVLVDRGNRKALLLVTDGVRGIAVVLVGLAAYAGLLQVWMVFAAGIIIGLGGSLFSPAVGSALPDLVPRDRLVQANSAFQLIGTGSGVLGNAAGGFLYQTLGAPLLFLFNGISYLFSSACLLLMKIPPVVSRRKPQTFFADMRDGFALVWNMRGLRALFLAASALNFFAVMGLMLLLPLSQRTPELGAARYGIMMGGLTCGLFMGFLLSSAVPIPPAARFRVFLSCGFTMCVLLAAVPLVRPFPVVVALMAAAGMANAILNSFIGAIVQITVPADMRGKAFSLLGALSQGLTPISMALGGILAEFLPLRVMISGAFGITFVLFVPLLFSGPFRAFVNFDPEKDAAAGLSG
jgi:MFS transporter, DHA3 family, macrolide efflux protein